MMQRFKNIMKRNNDYYVAIAAIKFKAPKDYRPSTLTYRKCFMCMKRSDAAVKREAIKTAEEWKRYLAENNHGVELSYTIKIETISVVGFDFIDLDGRPWQK